VRRSTSWWAGRFRLVRQALTESLLLSAAASLPGVVLAYFGAAALVRIVTSGRMAGPGASLTPRIALQVQPDAQVLLFTATVAVLTGVLFGLAPAWNAFAFVPAHSMRESGGAAETRSRRLFGKSLVVVQVALSVVLLSAAGLFVGHLSNLRNVNLGFQRDSVLLVTLNPEGSGYDRSQLTTLYRELLERLQAIPGVRSVTLSAVSSERSGRCSRRSASTGFSRTRSRSAPMKSACAWRSERPNATSHAWCKQARSVWCARGWPWARRSPSGANGLQQTWSTICL
jgi:hypothetical protein